jgi:hypothetical protein
MIYFFDYIFLFKYFCQHESNKRDIIQTKHEIFFVYHIIHLYHKHVLSNFENR